jgi:hypothetical protein
MAGFGTAPVSDVLGRDRAEPGRRPAVSYPAADFVQHSPLLGELVGAIGLDLPDETVQ